MAPTSQKAGERPISFLLQGGPSGQASVSLVIRPEDLSRVEPSRLAVQQTLGGAWADNFGPGLSTINISGHTGWRGGVAGDGEAAFASLRETVFSQWHILRDQAVKNGTSPDTIKLVFADSLDKITVNVAPVSFVLKRNRARPLLMMYQISMTVLGEEVAPVAAEIDPATGLPDKAAGVDSLTDSLRRLTAAAGNVRSFIDSSIVGPVESFLGVANGAMARALGAVRTVDGVIFGEAAQLVGLARDISQAGRNAFYTYNAIMSQPDVLRMAVSDVASAFDNAFCVLSNVFKRTHLYPDYSDIYGASNCSSTTGGSPLSPWRITNGLAQVTPQISAPFSVTSLAQSNISILRAADPVLSPMALTDLGNRMQSIGSGVILT